MLFLCVFLAFLFVANAHNWVNSYSRSPKDNTVAPALPSATGSAHVQVIAGQEFQVEWQQGHGSPTYFILAKKSDYQKLNNHKDLKNLDKYLESTGAVKTPPTGKWQKFHRTAGASPVNEHGGEKGFFKAQIPANNALYIKRSDVFTNNFKGFTGSQPIYQWTYKDDCTKTDRRTFHKNVEFPWILGMWRFLICAHEPARADVALFNVPPGTAPGEYLLHYRWRGYYDVVDVEVIAGTKKVALPYGEKPDPMNLPPPIFQRIPHCEFKNPEQTFRCMRVVASEQACVKRCGRSTFHQCDGVNVVRLVNVPGAKFFKDVNIPFDSGVGALCDRTTLASGGLTDAIAIRRRTKICYGLKAGNTPGIGQYYITNDPEDPAFYSTCHVRVPPVIRDGPAPKPDAPPSGIMPIDEFVTQGYCLAGCGWGYRNRHTDLTLHQPWRTVRCRDCRRLGKYEYMTWPFDWPTSSYKAPRVVLDENKKLFDGVNGNYQLDSACPPTAQGKRQVCMARVNHYAGRVGEPPVQMDTLLGDTVELIRRRYSNLCSNMFTTRFNQTDHRVLVSSFCVRKTPACCLNNPRRGGNVWAIYKIDQDWLDTPLPQ